MYVIRLSYGSLAAESSSLVELGSDEAAREVGRRLLEHEAARRPEPGGLSVLVGKGDGGDATAWLGAWRWDNAAAWLS